MRIDQKIVRQILDKKERLPKQSSRYKIFSGRCAELLNVAAAAAMVKSIPSWLSRDIYEQAVVKMVAGFFTGSPSID